VLVNNAAIAGSTAPDGHQGHQTLAEGAAPIVAVAGGSLAAPTGTLVDGTGVIPC
jgi:hypothetical protein